MLWQVRAVVEDRPGAVAGLAASFGAAQVNILALEIFPTGGGCVVDELVLATPDGWTSGDVERLCAEAGVVCVVVRRATTRVLEDQPVKWLRAAQVVLADPGRLEEQLCVLLGAVACAAHQDAGLVLARGSGPVVRLTRDVAFTDTEIARATELRRLVGASRRGSGDHVEGPARHLPLPPLVRPGPARSPRARRPDLVVRPGSATDAEALLAMHERCSAEVLMRRYHVPVGRLTQRDAVALLEPAGGRSLVAYEGDDLVAAGLVAADADRRGLVLHVEDQRQRRGTGARLMQALALEAADLGWDEVTCLAQPGDPAVLATVRRAGLMAFVSYVDGTCHHRIPLGRLRDGARVQASSPCEVEVLVAEAAGG